MTQEPSKAEKAVGIGAAIGTIWFGLFILVPVGLFFIILFGSLFASIGS